MKSKKVLLLAVVVVLVATVAQGSILMKRSLLSPLTDTCFTCRAEDRPLAYPLVSWFVKMKDMLVKGINGFMASAKDFKLDNMKTIFNKK